MAKKSKKIFISYDLAGAEWAIVAYLTGDANMLSVVESGRSPHTATAALMFDLTEEQVLLEEKALEGCTDPVELHQWRIEHGIGDSAPAAKTSRQGGKECNFSLNYDVGVNTFSERTMNPPHESKRLIRLYRNVAYPGLPRWHKHIRKLMVRDGFLVNCFGRRRDFYQKPCDELWRVGYAFLPQSTVYDVTRVGMVRIHNQEPEIELLMQVHDEVVLQAPADPAFLAEALGRIRTCMSVPLVYADPLGVERSFTLGVDGKVGFCKNKRFMVGVPAGADEDALRTAIEKAGELVGWGARVRKSLADYQQMNSTIPGRNDMTSGLVN